MVISISFSGRPSDSSGESKDGVSSNVASRTTSSRSLSVFGVDSDSDSAASDSLGSHPFSKRTKLSQNSGVDSAGLPRRTRVAEEKKAVVVKFKDYDLSTDSLDPELYLYDELEFSSSNDRHSSDDPSKLVYLGVAPSSSSDSVAPTVKKDSQYMSGLLRTARTRQLERSITFDKQQLKADLASGDSVGEVFVTGAYKRQLEERRRYEEEQRLKDEADLKNSGKSVANLHAHMLKSGIASRTHRNK
ncbi:uncharacterized protein BXIN_1479 [Babesia sp. Xinjiang]|uniref:uncharacterized protein n=1 Tax=Babesia sp. Xinjiang TaxID=462227 RepID=UPI000A247FB2|nr:uncharacterized protein BXIN_1479 [Babesia sp. Xinjiang]ORM40007.1 hypothetical protein BXIN_1479 [Babesia sp. Xinjiang]